MTARHPLWLDLTGRRVVVVGAGAVATRRVPPLIDAGAEVTVVAPHVAAGIASTPGLQVARRRYDVADLSGAWLVLACTDDPAVNAAVAADAEALGLWCVRADDADASAAWTGSIVEVDGVAVAVSGGADPRRAAAVRAGLQAALQSGAVSVRRHRRGGDGSVSLVGGGPGDPDLLTLKGFRALLDADVVVHDRLSPGGLLDVLGPDVEVVDVGKTPGAPSASQQDINKLLVDRARRGLTVVRLKGGDPFVFGRGSEELAACAEAGVAAEVIPGVSSALAGPALAGVPLTERGTVQLFSVVSGHVPPGDPRSTVDWAALAAAGGTIVALMAVGNLAAIASALVAAGLPAATPLAVIESASMPAQRVTASTVGTAAIDGLAADGVSNPAVIVIGDVASGAG